MLVARALIIGSCSVVLGAWAMLPVCQALGMYVQHADVVLQRTSFW